MRLETTLQGPRFRTDEEAQVKRTLSRLAEHGQCKFVCVQRKADLVAVVFSVGDSHASVASGFSDEEDLEIAGGGWVTFKRYNDEGEEVELSISEICFDSDSMRASYGTDRPQNDGEAERILAEVQGAILNVLKE